MITEPISVPVTPEKVTPIKPSEAIRLGCLLAPVQAFGWLGTGNEACALGAMLLGWGVDFEDCATAGARQRMDCMMDLTCPVAECRGGLFVPVAHLNDVHEWTREAIADWLETEHGL